MPRTSDARERLIRAAGELWHSRSYAEVGVNEICEHADVRKGSFYHFFPSKRDLALAVIDESWRRVKQQFLDASSDAALKPLERVVRFVELQGSDLETLTDSYGVVPGCPFGNLAVEMSTQDEVLRERLEPVVERTPWIAELRGRGLMLAIETVVPGGIEPDAAAAGRLLEAARERGVLVGKGGLYGNVIRTLMPLTITDAELEEGLAVLESCLQDAA